MDATNISQRAAKDATTELVNQLRPLMALFPGVATRGWLSKMAWHIWQLEATGATNFGGPDVLAWWLVQRCQPYSPLSKATIRKLQRMCGGSQSTLDRLVKMEQNRRAPTRLQIGWSFERVNSYLSMLRADGATASRRSASQ